MPDEPDNDHEGEEDVERKRNRKVRKGEVAIFVHPRAVVDEQHTRSYTDNVSLPEFCWRFVEYSDAHPKKQGT